MRQEHKLCQQSARYRAAWDESAPEFAKLPKDATDPAKLLGFTEPLPDKPASRYVRVGLGDIAARMTSLIGIKPCGGCKERQKSLNRFKIWLPKSIAPEPPPPTTSWVDLALPTNYGRPDELWAVGMTTAPRSSPSILRSLQSLAAAGWTDVRVFAEPGSTVPRAPGVVVNERTRGVFQNWYQGLRTLREEKPDAKFYALFQDDVVHCRGLKEFLERDLWFSDKVGFVSTYRSACKLIASGRTREYRNSDIYIDLTDGVRQRCKRSNGLWGACTYIFPARAVDVLLAEEMLAKRDRKIDLAIHIVLAAAGLEAWYYKPSLSQHIDGPSSIGHGFGKGMYAEDFVGEEFDARNHFKEAAA